MLPELAALHLDAIRSGSAMGFVEPIDPEDLDRHWRETVVELDANERVLVVAWLDSAVAGMAQLERSAPRNARHRGEVQRVAVASGARGRGVGRALMDALEEEARGAGVTLLYLTTHDDVPAARDAAVLGAAGRDARAGRVLLSRARMIQAEELAA